MPGYLREHSIVTSAAESLKKSMDQIEVQFSLSQLIIMGTIQQLQFEHEKNKRSDKRVVNKDIDPKKQNKKALRYL
uniref:Uncharacterized protein n=1 Tax=viral metagenome TaxID=1070528 RepID=A0A6M3LHN3_9ZZZZ